jgi:hypothetical protein
MWTIHMYDGLDAASLEATSVEFWGAQSSAISLAVGRGWCVWVGWMEWVM